MIQKKRLLVGAMAIVLATGIAAIADPPRQLPPQVGQAAPTSIYDPNVTPAGVLTPHGFGMERCDTCDQYVCRAQTKEVKKPIYTSKCVPFCLCKPFSEHHCADSCEECGVIAYKKVLVKKAKIVCETKCVPVPACGQCAPPK
jgi:hypothetical protein